MLGNWRFQGKKRIRANVKGLQTSQVGIEEIGVLQEKEVTLHE